MQTNAIKMCAMAAFALALGASAGCQRQERQITGAETETTTATPQPRATNGEEAPSPAGAPAPGHETSPGAQGNNSERGQRMGNGQNMATQSILTDLHRANQLEIQMGELAKDKGQSRAVKQYGERLVREHGQGDQNLQQLAKQNKIQLPDMKDKEALRREMTPEQQQMMKTLQQAKGADFDRQFANINVQAHRMTIERVRQAREQIQDQQTREFLERRVLPMLEQHLTSAESLQQQIRSGVPAQGRRPQR